MPCDAIAKLNAILLTTPTTRRIECCTITHVTHRPCGHAYTYTTHNCDGSVCGPDNYDVYRIVYPSICSECEERIARNEKAMGKGGEEGAVC